MAYFPYTQMFILANLSTGEEAEIGFSLLVLAFLKLKVRFEIFLYVY